MIEIKDLQKVYEGNGLKTIALSDIDLSVQRGDFLTIMGPSGCGKSSLLNIIGLLDTHNEGQYHLFGKDVSQLSSRERDEIRKKNIGFVFQNFNLIDELNVYDNIELPLLYNNIDRSERKIRIEEMLRNLKLENRRHHFPQSLSGGQQQRVAVARALVMEPALVLADEPTGNLDSKNGNEVMELLADLHRTGSTIVMVTHSQTDAIFSRRIVRLKDGQIVSQQENRQSIKIIDRENNPI